MASPNSRQRLLCRCSALIVFCSASALAAQQHQHPKPAAAGSPVLPLGTIQGSKTPFFIPDAVAYRLVFLALSEPPQASTEQLKRQRVKLSPVDLGGNDQIVMIDVLTAFYSAHADLERRYQVAIVRGSAGSSDFNADRDALVQKTRDLLKSRITEDGFVRLDRFIQGEKTKMTIVPFPAMK